MFSVPTETTSGWSSIKIFKNFLVLPQQKSLTCVISRPYNSFSNSLKNHGGLKWLQLDPSLSNLLVNK